MRIAQRLITRVVVVTPLLLAGCRGNANTDIAIEALPVSRGNLVQEVTATGALSATVSVDVGAQVSGKITMLAADYNSPVRKGQLIAQIDPTLYLATLQQAQGELASARANVTVKRQNLERKRALVPVRAASQLDLDIATAELAQAEASVIIRQATVQSAKANVDFCRITAPVDGIVIARRVDIGQTVIAAMNAPVLFTVAQDLKKMNISASVSEADIGQIREGQVVTFTVDAYPDDVFRGEVSQIRRSPTTTQNVVTYETVITVQNEEQKLFPGMTAEVAIRIADRRAVLHVPNAALRFTPGRDIPVDGALATQVTPGTRVLYTRTPDGKRVHPQVVRVGITDGVSTEVLAGLSEGSEVVTAAGIAKPKSGVQLTPTRPKRTPDEL
jgi:HlyD family secretion protein